MARIIKGESWRDKAKRSWAPGLAAAGLGALSGVLAAGFFDSDPAAPTASARPDRAPAGPGEPAVSTAPAADPPWRAPAPAAPGSSPQRVPDELAGMQAQAALPHDECEEARGRFEYASEDFQDASPPWVRKVQSPEWRAKVEELRSQPSARVHVDDRGPGVEESHSMAATMGGAEAAALVDRLAEQSAFHDALVQAKEAARAWGEMARSCSAAPSAGEAGRARRIQAFDDKRLRGRGSTTEWKWFLGASICPGSPRLG